jgi:hypothetical protein
MNMIEHVSQQDLLLAYDGELPPDRQETVHAHARSCPQCREQWLNLADLSQRVVAVQCPKVRFRPQEAAVEALLSRLDSEPVHRGTHWTSHLTGRSLAVANTLAAVAVAITCIVLAPSINRRSVVHVPSAGIQAPLTEEMESAVPPGYVSLPYADPALPLDDSEVLPVELSAEDLELMGLSASDASGDATRDRVQAEILIGMDGWPRAIRIVQ